MLTVDFIIKLFFRVADRRETFLIIWNGVIPVRVWGYAGPGFRSGGG